MVPPRSSALARALTHTFVASLDTRRARQEFEFIASGASSASTDLHSLLIQLLAIRNLRVVNLFSSWQYGCTLIMPEGEVGLASKSAAWCWKSKSRGIALRSISETRQKNLEQVSRSWTTRRDVRLADRDAVKFLRDCEADGMKLENCPEYVREWMDREED
jgi:hypothetical protein